MNNINDEFFTDYYYDIKLDRFMRDQGRGNTRSSIHNILKNKNFLGGMANMPEILESSGLVFIAPPDLNLSHKNIYKIRELSPLLTSNRLSLGSTIRDNLDPRGAWDNRHSLLNDPSYPFIGLLDNTLLTLDGWPSYVIDEYVGHVGAAGSTVLTAKGRINKYQQFPLTATHRNLPGDAVNMLYTIMSYYYEHVHLGTLYPYRVNVLNNRIDYYMRIYRFIFDQTGTKVNQFTMTGAGFPRGGNQGAAMDYSSENSINEGYETVSANWTNIGCFHNDPIVIVTFNQLVERFNEDMRDGFREKYLVRVGSEEGLPSLAVINPFQYNGYPRINPITLDFEVWVYKPIYDYLTKGSFTSETLLAIEQSRDASMLEYISRLPPELVDGVFSNIV